MKCPRKTDDSSKIVKFYKLAGPVQYLGLSVRSISLHKTIRDLSSAIKNFQSSVSILKEDQRKIGLKCV